MEASIDFGDTFRKILKEIKEEADYKTIFVQRRHIEDCVDPSILQHFNAPTVIWDETHYGDILYDYGTHLLVILCLKTVDDGDMMHQLAESIHYMRTARILCIVNESLLLLDELKISKFFEMCAQLEMINILVLHRDSFIFEKYHSYKRFPNFALETHDISRNEGGRKWYPDRLKDFVGANLTAIPNFNTHRVFIEKAVDGNVDGNVELCGSLARFAQTFCEFINASLLYTGGELYDYFKIIDAMEMGHIDIGLDFDRCAYRGQSRVLEISRMSVVVPLNVVPPLSALSSVFLNRYTLLPFALQTVVLPFVISKFLQWINGRWQPIGIWRAVAFIGDTGLRSFLGQSLNLPHQQTIRIRFLFGLLLFGGMIIQTFFAANYARLQTFPPLRPKVVDYEDAMRKGFKIYTHSEEMIDFLAIDVIKQKYKSLFFEDLDKFQKPMKLLTDAGYLVDRISHEIFDQGSLKMVFNENLDITDMILLSYMVRNGSALKQPIDDFTDIVQESGLYKYWERNPCKRRRITASHGTYEDPSAVQLTVSDLHGVWLVYVGGHIICVFVFLCELFGRRFLALFRSQH
ncbi:uncharacterized protein LOC101453222 [Ceratitis capitata]|uniref:uncharacterized protein LOC101453222 n=1 Tax=Ceratitis capitata TaxID=7213 RepID=UPI00032A3C49|nr:uncharacterized protein LOC101453222 [Ceratitis capitata]